MKKKIFTSLVVTSMIVGITGCSSLFGPSYQSISKMSTMDILHAFKKGETTMSDVKRKFGNPSKENIISLAEAKSMFQAKNTDGDVSGDWVQTYKKIASIQAKVIRNINGKDSSLNKEVKIEENKRVVLWIYNDYTESSSIFNPLEVKRKGAKLLLIFDPDTQKLIDYKFQKYDS